MLSLYAEKERKTRLLNVLWEKKKVKHKRQLGPLDPASSEGHLAYFVINLPR